MSAAYWRPAYVAIGSNLDDPPAQISAAFDELAKLHGCRLIARSRLYRSAPLGPQSQPEFINAAAGLLTQLGSRELLTALKQTEARLGRAQPVERWGPRRIDLDLLMVADEQIDEPDFTLPHRGLTERNFVLYPLREIAPVVLVPGRGRRVDELAARIGAEGLALFVPA